MATWKSENSMLTQRGVEILNKLKAGIGSITVTRVVLGSDRVSDSQLFTQTSMSGDTKDVSISKINTDGSGSELSFYVSNEDFYAPFTIQQLGVYVTHPDYTGEQLYHISQCDADGADTLPAGYETKITQWYSIYMEHGNSDSISLTVDPTGMVSREEFDALTKNAVPGNLVVVDENHKLIDTGVKVTDLGSSSRNLVHNYNLADPIDTKGGLYVSQGVPYYSDVFMNEYVKGTDSPVTAVLNANGYGEIVIDGTKYYVQSNRLQRGYVADNNSVNPVITFDRWVLLSPDGASTVAKNDTFAYLILAKNGSFYQEIASTNSPAKYGGKKFILTAKIEQPSNGEPVLFINNGKETFEFPIDILYSGYYSVTGTIDADSTAFTVGIKNKSTSQSSHVKVSVIKLEVGENSTLEKDLPADKAEQMAICVQYDPITGSYRGFPYTTTANILAEATVTE